LNKQSRTKKERAKISEKDHPRIRVMLVDDNAVVCQALQMFLGLDPELNIVCMAKNGRQAISRASRFLPDVILMDLLMPVMDGLTAIQRIKREHAEIEIIVLTSILDEEKVYKAIHAGAIGYLLKDTTANELTNAIKAASRGEVQLHPEAAKRLAREVCVPESPEKLTERETEVLCLIAKGMSNKDIASHLVVSEKMVKTHVSNVLVKLHLPSRTQAALYALREGMVLLAELSK